MSRNRQSVILFLVAGCLAATGGCGEGRGQGTADPARLLPTDPGLSYLVVSFDALRANALGAYGATEGATPTMDAFAAESLVFERAYTAGQATPSSFAAAFTGRYPLRSLLGWSIDAESTLAETFAAAGFATAAFINNRHLDAVKGIERGYGGWRVDFEPDDDAFLEHPLQWLRQNQRERFFLWIHFITPHAPYTRREMASRFYTPGYEGRFADDSGKVAQLDRIDDERDLARLRDLYTGEVFYADHLFGRLLAELDGLGLAERTVVVLTADHGEEFMEHGTMGHRQVYDEVVHIPFILRHPGLTDGARAARPIVNVDYLPSLAGLAGLEAPSGLDGVDFRLPADDRRPLLFTSMTTAGWRSVGLREGDHKLIVDCTAKSTHQLRLARGSSMTPKTVVRRYLFDLAKDPRERIDLQAAEPERALALFTVLEELIGGEPCRVIEDAMQGVAPTRGLDPEQIEQLKSLGYVD